MENNVVTLDTAKKLKATGFPQRSSESVWGSYPGEPDRIEIKTSKFRNLVDHNPAAELSVWDAPTAQEIADQLEIHTKLVKLSTKWTAYIDVPDNSPGAVYADTMAEALAQLYLAVHANPNRKGDES